ncbi:hypothetical protein [Streptomyces sp. WAC 06738]|uniref:hypothetical protein n=1 Tax=Streptomyces sp. WAC 06738 TaxID=2203210 RepID=UPI0019CF9998|nr:hypothetical protein [Streptomyces sp. WAC 06738]
MYGIDVEDAHLLRRRSWRWLKIRIFGLLSNETSRLFRHFAPPPEDIAKPTR